MSLGNTFVPLTLDLVEEGDFREAINAAMAEVQRELANYVARWEESAKGAKAALKIELVFKCSNTADAVFAVESKLSSVMPKRPTRSTAAFANYVTDAKTGKREQRLFVRGTGSTEGDPTQFHLPIPHHEPSEEADV